MKILLVSTGGTIGCSVNDGVADVDSETARTIAAICEKYSGAQTEVAFPFNMLSENATCATLSRICSFMLGVDYSKYSGVIVTHGSDTLAYTANLLAAALAWVDIPVVITAANYVMTDARSNAADNLAAACILIRELSEKGRGGVFAAWKNDGEPPRIHLASRLLEADAPRGYFDSYGGAIFGSIYSDRFFPCPAESFPEPKTELAFLKGRSVEIKPNVMLLHSFVGLDYNTLNIKGKGAVLLKLYHSGTACMEGGSASFSFLAEKCRASGAALYICPARLDTYVYGSNAGLSKAHAVPVFAVSEFFAYTALLLAYSLGERERQAVLDALL